MHRGDWTAVCKDSVKQFRPISIDERHLAVDREMNFPNIVNLNYFVFSSFSVIDSSRNSSAGLPGPSDVLMRES